ncbi:MAG: hypothetical protein HYU30_08085 [Chloroflexi bacterium]|nr:hypothetical protein [Chloroflexota bacterium]
MASQARLVRFGIPALVVVLALIAAMALWAFNPSGGAGENALIKTNVDWKVFGADGVLKSQGVGHNFTSSNFVNDARTRLSTVTTVDAAALYSNISACSTASTGVTANGATPTAACTLSSNIGTNPVLASVTNTSQGVYTAVTTFTATDASTINELELSKTLAASTAPTTATIGAVKLVTIVLAAADTLQVTWTITVT